MAENRNLVGKIPSLWLSSCPQTICQFSKAMNWMERFRCQEEKQCWLKNSAHNNTYRNEMFLIFKRHVNVFFVVLWYAKYIRPPTTRPKTHFHTKRLCWKRFPLWSQQPWILHNKIRSQLAFSPLLSLKRFSGFKTFFEFFLFSFLFVCHLAPSKFQNQD